MNTIESIREFLGWCSVINIGIMTLAWILVVALRDPISHFQAKLFNLDERDISRACFQFLAQYKVAVYVFNIVPYFTLGIIS